MLDLFKNIYFFNALTDHELNLLLNSSTKETYTKGEIIIRENLPGNKFFIVAEGAVEIWKNFEKTNSDKLLTLYSGNFFGEMSLIDDLPRSATAVAVKDSVLLSIKGKDFKDLIASNISIAMAVMKSMSMMIRESTDHYAGHLRIKDQHLIKEMADRKKTEDALTENERKFRLLAENVTDIMWIINAKHLNFTYVSPSAEKILGFSPEDMTSLFLQDVLTPESVKIALNNFSKIKKNGNAGNDDDDVIQLEAYNANGSTVWLEASSHFLKIDQNQPDSLIGVARDITKRKLIETELEKSRALFAAAVNQSTAGVLITDETGLKIKVSNSAAETILGISKAQLLSTTIDNLSGIYLFYPDKTKYKKKDLPLVRTSSLGETITNEEILIHRPDGTSTWILLNAAPLKDKNGKIFGSVTVFPDITAIKKMDEKNLEFENKLQQARKMESISTLAGGVAHEFNNALFGITGNVDLLDMHLEATGNISRYIKAIKNSTTQMTNLTKQLLAYSRGGKYQPRTVYISHIVEKTLPKFTSSDSDTQFRTKFYPNESYIEADITQIQMVISAIIKNSVESITSNGIISFITKTITISQRLSSKFNGLKPGKYSCLTIRDNGRGMHKNILDKIFEPFFTTNLQGRGLGMAAVYGIVKNHMGWIGVTSKIDVGTTVKIYIPSKDIDKQKDSENNPLSSGCNILLVEDEDAAMAVNREMIEFLGHSALEAKTGAEAIKIIENYQSKIDLTILDYDLPDMKGDKVYRIIKKTSPDIKIIFSTGYDVDDIASEMGLDNKHFIQKPYSLSKLSSALKILFKDKE